MAGSVLLGAKRDALLRVFQDLRGHGQGGKVMQKGDFRESMLRLGLGLSTNKCDQLFDRVDVVRQNSRIFIQSRYCT